MCPEPIPIEAFAAMFFIALALTVAALALITPK